MGDWIRNENLAVTATSRQIADDMSGRGGRVSIVIRNTSPNAADVITVSLGQQAAVATAGIVLRQGEVWYDSNDSGYLAFQNQIEAVCATANGTLALMER